MTGGDLLRDAVAELYAADPDVFVARRGELAAQARAAGDAPAAKQISALRKPTRSAWVVNQLARAEPAATAQLAELGAELRAAQGALDGPAIRELSRQRHELIEALTRQAFSAAGQRLPSATVRDEVTGTLGAALADPQVAEQLRAGTLDRPARRDGFGSAADSDAAAETDSGEISDWMAAPESAPGSGSLTGPRTIRGQGGTVVPLRAGAPGPGDSRDSSSRSGSSRGGSSRGGSSGSGTSGTETSGIGAARPRQAGSPGAGPKAAPAGGRPAAKVTALAAARERAERERRREAVAAAQLALDQADRTERRAAHTERDQETLVSELEAQLIDARQRLAEARLQAHRARTAQRRARRALDKLQD